MREEYIVEREYLSKISIEEFVIHIVKAHIQADAEQVIIDKK